MKIGTVLLGLIFALMSVNTASARGKHGHHYDYGHHNDHHYDSGHHYGHRERHYDTHHQVHHYNSGQHTTYREVHHYNDRHQGDKAAYLIGGLIVGGIIGALNQANQSAIYNSNRRQPIYVNPYR